ncbi:MAG: VanZ family protein [Lachnospiraceae bacterium]|nr:VanZ family protein [Lachnospiraceae bacterium]
MSTEMLVSLIVMFIALLFTLFSKNSNNTKGKSAKWILLIEYVFLILCITILSRRGYDSKGVNLVPFWSYSATGEFGINMIAENVLNVILFIPFGFLIGFIIRFRKWKIAMIIGCALSITIELLQLILRKGFCEFDDVFHNTLGCLIGYGLYILIVWCKRILKKH